MEESQIFIKNCLTKHLLIRGASNICRQYVWFSLESGLITIQSVKKINSEAHFLKKFAENNRKSDQTWLKMMRHRYTTSAMILLSQQRVCSPISIHPTKLSLTSEMPRIFTHTAIIFKKFHWQIDSTEVLF